MHKVHGAGRKCYFISSFSPEPFYEDMKHPLPESGMIRLKESSSSQTAQQKKKIASQCLFLACFRSLRDYSSFILF